MYYPGDTYNFILNIPNTGSTVVSSAPLITILDILNPGTPIVSGASMTLVTGTSYVYYYSFTIPNASPKDYIAIYSYATTSPAVTVSNQLISLKDELHVGDSYVTGPVALNATVAQNATVAKDATVMKSSQYVAPQNDPTIQTIATQTATINSNTASTSTLLGTLAAGTLSGLIQDIYDYSFGAWSIDNTVVPPVLYISRVNGTPIASFQLLQSVSSTQRVVITSPPESNV
jgi:hypothetical protein